MQVTGNGRVRRTEAEWRGLVSQWTTSGQSLRDFCRAQEIEISSFHRWRQRLASSSTVADFVPVKRAASPTVASSSWSLELVLPNGCTLRFQG